MCVGFVRESVRFVCVCATSECVCACVCQEEPMQTDETPSPLAPTDSKKQSQEGHVVQEGVAAVSAAPSNSGGSSSSLPSAGPDSTPVI